MADFTPDVLHVEQFNQMVGLDVQQLDGMFGALANEEGQLVGRVAYFDRYGANQWSEITDGKAPIPLGETDRRRRAVFQKEYEYAEVIQTVDLLKTLHDPRNPLRRVAGGLINRGWDEILKSAAVGSAYEGQNGATTVPYDTTNQQVAHGSASLTVSKVKDAAEIFKSRHAWMPGRMHFFVDADLEKDLINDATDSAQVLSRDYTSASVIERGTIGDAMWMGFRWHVLGTTAQPKGVRLPTSSNGKLAIAAVEDSVGIHRSAPGTVEFVRRTDLQGMPWMMHVYAAGGATRVDDELIVRVETNVSF